MLGLDGRGPGRGGKEGNGAHESVGKLHLGCIGKKVGWLSGLLLFPGMIECSLMFLLNDNGDSR